MSLVHLANVCSHLQNASKARLGLTSIPMTKLHLRLALGLQKQGLLSTVQVAGPTPPLPPQITEQEADARERLEHQLEQEPWQAYPTGKDGNLIKTFQLKKRTMTNLENQLLVFLQMQAGGDLLPLVEEKFAEIRRSLWTTPVMPLSLPDRTAMTAPSLESISTIEAEVSSLTGALREQGIGFETSITQELENPRQEQIEEKLRKAELREQQLAISGRVRPEEVTIASLAQSICQELSQSTRSQIDTASEEAQSDVIMPTPSTPTTISPTLLYNLQTHLQSQLAHAMSASLSESSASTASSEDPTADQDELSRHTGSVDPAIASETSQIPKNPAQRRIWLGLKYYNSEPVLSKLSLVSKPTRRIHVGADDLRKIVRGRDAKTIKGIRNPGECLFLSTDRGIWEARECAEKGVGGVALCRAE